MISKLFCAITVINVVYILSIFASEESILNILEEWNQDQEPPIALTSGEVSSPIIATNDNTLQYLLWMKRAADGARGGGAGRNKQLRYHHCYFNPISCFKKRTMEYSSFYKPNEDFD